MLVAGKGRKIKGGDTAHFERGVFEPLLAAMRTVLNRWMSEALLYIPVTIGRQAATGLRLKEMVVNGKTSGALQ